MLQERKDILTEVIHRVSLGGMPQEEFEKIRYLIFAPGLNVEEYIETAIDFGDMIWTSEGGNKKLCSLAKPSQRTRLQITQKLDALAQREQELVSQNTDFGDPRFQEIRIWREVIQWFTQK